MERLTSYDGDYYYPHCMNGSTCDGRGSSEKCNECEFDESVCVTLGKYEDTDLTPEQIMELKERDTAKTPIKDSDSGVRYTDDYICPNCGKHFTGTGIAAFCYHCGQRLKWEE